MTETEVDFGSVPRMQFAFTITDGAVSSSSKIIVSHSGKAATGRQSDENELDQLICNANPGTGTFTLNCGAHPGPVTGKYKVVYTVG